MKFGTNIHAPLSQLMVIAELMAHDSECWHAYTVNTVNIIYAKIKHVSVVIAQMLPFSSKHSIQATVQSYRAPSKDVRLFRNCVEL